MLLPPKLNDSHFEENRVEALKSRPVAQMLIEGQNTWQATQYTEPAKGGAAAKSLPKVHKKKLGNFFREALHLLLWSCFKSYRPAGFRA